MAATVRCAAKLNLYLEVLGPRPDGYHDILTFFQPVDLRDEIVIERRSSGIDLAGNDPSIPWDESNLCHRAAALILDAAGRPGGVAIEVHKRIPAGAGLGGGSSDAAGVLAGIDHLYGLGLGEDALASLALQIGSDAPFFVRRRPAIGRGRGEELEPVAGLRGGWFVVAKPPESVSTAAAYAALDFLLTTEKRKAKLSKLLEGLEAYPDDSLDTFNSFERAVARDHPGVGRVLRAMRDSGPDLCSLSGSGSACFALYREEDRARRMRDGLRGEGLFAEITRPIDEAMTILHTE
ncbi:MAG: 4-(cytidine 5'-diphospho)-2-C-methyl-D-erythritol kinase [Candidatus Krumholzibacteriota bacterium]|nr:4-(cytidine 5'-diphospho)-2-C-methyl-D-erythritol kinase [Candidatus Krumholzibacteriota bacterium]